MSDPIKAALDAATLATLTDGERDDPPARGQRRRAAETVAAFLRALPACDVLMDSTPGDPESGPHSTSTLAAAVERAAQEGGHD